MSYWDELFTQAEIRERKVGGKRRGVRTHGKRTTYRSGCRCRACREAHNVYHRDRYRAKVGKVANS